MSLSRRKLMRCAAAAAAGVMIERGRVAQALETSSAEKSLAIRCYDAAGNPMPASQLEGLFLFEASADRNPIPHPPRQVLNGLVRTAVPDGPFGCSLILTVEGFGTVRLYADNGGRGYRPGQEVVLNRELAASRLAAVQAEIDLARAEGVNVPDALLAQVRESASLLRQADAAGANVRQAAPLCMRSLRESLWAGERAALARARHAIANRGPRRGFLFGCNFFGYPSLGEEYAASFAKLFNFATLPFYWRSFEPEEGKPRFERVDPMLLRLQRSAITAKGHPLCWFHEAGCPAWMMGRSFNQWAQEQRRRITQIVSRYRGRIKVYDVINEAHDWGNDPQFSQEQLLEMTRISADATREADPDAVRVVNNCCIFGEYVAGQSTYKGRQPRPLRTPLQYLRAVIKAGVDFHAVGLQVYYPGHDMLEISRMLSRYAAFGKPIHITELGVASRDDRDEKSNGKDPGKAYWHGPWSEAVQADWIEQFYTLCYAHDSVEAITWWDFSDVGGHFWPHGGFIRPDGQPKESYHRLSTLIRKWNEPVNTGD